MHTKACKGIYTPTTETRPCVSYTYLPTACILTVEAAAVGQPSRFARAHLGPRHHPLAQVAAPTGSARAFPLLWNPTTGHDRPRRDVTPDPHSRCLLPTLARRIAEKGPLRAADSPPGPRSRNKPAPKGGKRSGPASPGPLHTSGTANAKPARPAAGRWQPARAPPPARPPRAGSGCPRRPAETQSPIPVVLS